MSDRFNRNDTNVPDDRLFANDFIVDQNGQDADLLQIAKDFGCLPCIGSGLGVTSKSEVDHKVEVAAGWAYDSDGHRITISSAQEVVLTDTAGGNNYIILSHAYTTDTSRNAHRTGASYDTRKHDSFLLSVQSSAPGVNDICLANCKQTGTGTITIEVTERLDRTCKLIPHSSIPEVAEEEGTGTGAETPPPGQQPELPDYPKGKGVSRKVPMPIILSGTRDGAAWDGIETILAEELGRTSAAQSALTLERVTGKTGTPLADVQVWIGDWGVGQRDGVDLKKCNFTMPTESGVSAWDADLWITDPPGYYYLVLEDESWFSRITDSGSDWVKCEEDLPDASSHTFYVCAYAERYRSQAIPYKTDAALDLPKPKTSQQMHRIASPTAPLARIEGLNLGGKYRIKIASLVSNDNYTKQAEADFIVGSDLVDDWSPSASYITAEPVDGGVKVTVPAHSGGTTEPEAFEACYTFGVDSVPTPDFTDSTHPSQRFKERVFKLDVPPGNKVKVKVRSLYRRMVMQDGASANKELTHEDDYVVAGGVSLRRNRKQITGLIDESSIAASGTSLADEIALANPVWPEKIRLFNPTGSSQADFEVYIHGSNQPYTDGRKIQIGTGGDQATIASKGNAEKTFSDYRITDAAMKITIKNIHASSAQSFTLRYTVQYFEDSDTEAS